MKVAFININSVRHKFEPLREVLTQGFLDILFVQETKLDDSFPDSQFEVDNFKLYRQDCSMNMGGLMALIRNDITHKRRNELEFQHNDQGRIETMVFEVLVKHETWILSCIYKQPKVKNQCLSDCLENHYTKCLREASNQVILGDLNIDMSVPKHCLLDFCDIHGVKNIVNKPTCFKGNNPSTVDVVLSNVHKKLQGIMCIETGLSDFHNMVVFATKAHIPVMKPRKFVYRSYKNFQSDEFCKDLSLVPFHVSEVFDDAEDSYWFCENLLKEVINKHAPMKSRTIRYKPAPYMNGELRKAINYKNNLKRKFERNKSKAHWKMYRSQRNYVTRLRKQSMKFYLLKCCNQESSKQTFWNVIKPLISDKCKTGTSSITLCENGCIINDQTVVCNCLNAFYNTIGSDTNCTSTSIPTVEDHDELSVLQNIIKKYDEHVSIHKIRNMVGSSNDNFKFQNISVEEVHKRLRCLSTKKSTGYDNIPPKLLKIGADVICYPLCNIINMCINSCTFPVPLKKAEIVPLFKKGDNHKKENYRPVSILPCISKIFESVLLDQLSRYFESFLSDYVSGFRKQHSCQSVLLRFVEYVKQHMENNEVTGVVLTDLSKAFDCLPHDLLIAKMHALVNHHVLCYGAVTH